MESGITLDMLKVQTPDRGLVSVGEGDWGAVYADYLKNAGNRNIVWKRRQMGMTTFSLARGFLKATVGKTCIVAVHRPEAAAHMWGMVEVFIENLPSPLPIKWKSSGTRTFGLEGRSPSQFQIVNPHSAGVGKGRMIDFVHLGEFAWWSREDQERAWDSLGPCLSPDAEVIIESTPGDNDSGLFHKIWRNAEAYGFTRHFFPWWKSPQCVAEAVDEKTLTESELSLIVSQGLSLEQIGWRRKVRGQYMATDGTDKCFKVEYGENPETVLR